MNLPASFIDYTRALLGNEEYEKLAAALQQEPPVSIRINKLRMKDHDDPPQQIYQPGFPVPAPSGCSSGRRRSA